MTKCRLEAVFIFYKKKLKIGKLSLIDLTKAT